MSHDIARYKNHARLKKSYLYIKMSFDCEFCKTSFQTKRSLVYHKRTAKYCNNCDRNFTSKRAMEYHTSKCVQKNQDIIDSLRTKLEEKKVIIASLESIIKCQLKTTKEQSQQISELQNNMMNVAIQGIKKSTTTNTTTNILNMQQPLTNEWVTKNADRIESKDLISVIALASFASKNTFSGNHGVCSDVSRGSFRFKDKDGVLIKDPLGKKLAQLFCASIESKANSLIPVMKQMIINELNSFNIETHNIEDITRRMDDLIQIQNGIEFIAEGKEHELREKFIAEMCKLLPSM